MGNNIFDGAKITILDGGFGTMLQASGVGEGCEPILAAIRYPDIVENIHIAYAAAGADIICANTFGANAKKLQGSGYTVEQVIGVSVDAARRGAKSTGARVALDVGPLGELLEPGGTLAFEQAYNLFAEMMLAGEASGAQLILIETMTDLYEAKAAVLAAIENTHLPVMVSMTFEATGRTFGGTPVEAMALTLEGLGVSALGINCSLGPAEILPLARRLCSSTNLPVFLKPNAGLPDPATGVYSLDPDTFCAQLAPALEFGVSALGGCCGTTPQTIQTLAQICVGRRLEARSATRASFVCSGTSVLNVLPGCAIGERINPTGKKKLREALQAGDIGHVRQLAVSQQQDGAQILDINVGAPGVDEEAMLPRVVKAVQAVCSLPLQLDSANPKALAAALRVYNGKAVVNSTTGEKHKLDAVLPICKKYGAAVVGLTLDENGIPDTSEGRLSIARNIMEAALAAGIAKEDVYIDCLVLAASAEPGAADVTLRAVELVKRELGLKTLLGVSNISFGLPNRPLVNQSFLAMAMQSGLDLPILNPADEGMRGTLAAWRMLTGVADATEAFVAAYGSENMQNNTAKASLEMDLNAAIVSGLEDEAERQTQELLAKGVAGLDIANKWLVPALDKVGLGFEKGQIFLPQLLSAAAAAGRAFELIRKSYGAEHKADGPIIVLATVQGDIHDIGKNIVRVLLENYGFRVVDLGRDVPPQEIVEAARSTGALLVGLSALMTTTLPAMQQSILALRQAGLNCKVVVGGAVLTEEYALKIGADYYAKDAMRTVDIARQLHSLK